MCYIYRGRLYKEQKEKYKVFSYVSSWSGVNPADLESFTNIYILQEYGQCQMKPIK